MKGVVCCASILPLVYLPPSREATPHKYRIAETKEAPIEWDRENFGNGIMIYTDGSCYKDKVGASAVIYINGIETPSLKFQLRTAQEHTVFEVELTGIILGTQLASQHLSTGTPINFSIDNQATILSMQKNTRQPAQYLLDEIHKGTKKLLHQIEEEQQQEIRLRPPDDGNVTPHSPISFTWIAGHRDSTGNERADTLAKDASERGSSRTSKLPTFLRNRLPISISAIKQMIT